MSFKLRLVQRGVTMSRLAGQMGYKPDQNGRSQSNYADFAEGMAFAECRSIFCGSNFEPSP